MAIYDKLDLRKYGNELHQTTTTLTIAELSYLKTKYGSINGFIREKILMERDKFVSFIEEKSRMS